MLPAPNSPRLADYFAKRTALQQKSIDLQIDQARSEKALATEAGARRKLEEQIITLQRDRAEIATRAALEQKKAEEGLAKQLGEVKIRLLELDGETARAERAKLEEEYKDLFVRLRAESDETGRAMVANLIDRLVAKSKQDELRAAMERITSDLQGKESSISTQMDAGTLGYTEGERRLQEVRQRTLEQLRELQAQQQKYLGTLKEGTPEHVAALQGLMSIETGIVNIRASMDTLGRGIADGGLNALRTLFTSIREEGSLTIDLLKAAVANFADSIYDVLMNDIAQAAISSVRGIITQATGWLSSLKGGVQAATETTAAATAAATTTTAATTAAATTTAAAATAAATVAGGATTAGVTLTTAAMTMATTIISAATTAASIMAAQNVARSFSFGAAHGGGVAGALRMMRNNINPAVFGAAPRYHGGGVAGLQNDEIPAILKRGEIVRTRQQENALQARLNAGQDSGEQPIRNIIVFSDDELASALSGAAGEKVVVNHVRRNRGGING